MMDKFIVEMIYPNDDVGFFEEFTSLDEAMTYFNVTAKEFAADSDGYDYLSLQQIDADDNHIETLKTVHFNSEVK